MDLMTDMMFDCALTDDSEVSLNWKDRFYKSVGTNFFQIENNQRNSYVQEVIKRGNNKNNDKIIVFKTLTDEGRSFNIQ